jgi:hypothetical protein
MLPGSMRTTSMPNMPSSTRRASLSASTACFVEEVGLDGVQAMFDVNVLGVIRMVRAVAPVMRRQGAGRVGTIGSIGGRMANPANGTYTATSHTRGVVGPAVSPTMTTTPSQRESVLTWWGARKEERRVRRTAVSYGSRPA